MAERARVLVHGATGFTGRLVCAALRRRGVVFAVSGRDSAKLDALADELGVVERYVVRVGAVETIEGAVSGRTLVCACAGPFVQVGEAVLAACARAGVHYVDTTGEQEFVARAVARYGAEAKASGACVVPAMAYEIALADWGAHLAAEDVGGAPEAITITYASPGGGSATRGTKKSALGVIAGRFSKQFVDGALVDEPIATVVRDVVLEGTNARERAVSFPSPEAVVVASHTGARTVRTFMTASKLAAWALHVGGGAVPPLVRLLRRPLEAMIDRAAPGPEGDARRSRFAIVCEAVRGPARAEVTLRGRDPYGLTAELQAYAAVRALEGRLSARGVVAPSVAFDASSGLSAMGELGVEVTR